SSATLTLDLANNETFSNAIVDNSHLVATGLLSNNYTIASLISGTGKLAKTGGNTVTISNSNTFKGPTTISGGTLLVTNTTGSATGIGTVAVNNGGTLG